MKAALLVRPGVIEIGDVPEPRLQPDDVLIAVVGVGLCGSDLSVFQGHWATPGLPWVMGHEAFGRIEAAGERVPAGRVGEVVVIEPNIPCFRCAWCLNGRTSNCRQRQSVGMNRSGALAEKVAVPSAFAWAVVNTRPADLVCIEPLAVVETALGDLPAALPRSALVIGAGAQGLLTSLGLMRRGVEVSAVDLNPERVALAATLGARPVPDEDAGAQFELVVDTAGTPRSFATALRSVESSGTVLVLGLDRRPFQLSASVLVRRQLNLRGSLIYDHPHDFRHTIDLVESGAITPGRIVTSEFGLDDAQQAFESSTAAAGKTWIRVDPAFS